MVDVTMPRLSDSMEEGTIVEWLKAPGDPIARGEPLVEVETDKATIVYEAEQDGVLAELVVAEGGSAPLGAVIARITVETALGAEPEPREPARAARARATPVARRLAHELGVGLEGVSGTGPGGRIVRADVRALGGDVVAEAAETGPRGVAAETPLTTTQRTIARRMAESRSDVPDFTVESEIDMDAAYRWREEWRAAHGDPVPSFNDLVVKAVARALRDHPGLNAAYEESRALRFSRINVGVAVATGDALYVPTIFDADLKSVAEIAAMSRQLSERVRTGSITAEELDGGTFTVSNLGMFGVRRFQAVVNRPQAAILAVGELSLRPWVTLDGGLVARHLMEVALSCDHRIVYGADGARFLQRVRELLEAPVHLDRPGGGA